MSNPCPEREDCPRCDHELDDHALAVQTEDKVMFWICPTSTGTPTYESMGEPIQ